MRCTTAVIKNKSISWFSSPLYYHSLFINWFELKLCASRTECAWHRRTRESSEAHTKPFFVNRNRSASGYGSRTRLTLRVAPAERHHGPYAHGSHERSCERGEINSFMSVLIVFDVLSKWWIGPKLIGFEVVWLGMTLLQKNGKNTTFLSVCDAARAVEATMNDFYRLKMPTIHTHIRAALTKRSCAELGPSESYSQRNVQLEDTITDRCDRAEPFRWKNFSFISNSHPATSQFSGAGKLHVRIRCVMACSSGTCKSVKYLVSVYPHPCLERAAWNVRLAKLVVPKGALIPCAVWRRCLWSKIKNKKNEKRKVELQFSQSITRIEHNFVPTPRARQQPAMGSRWVTSQLRFEENFVQQKKCCYAHTIITVLTHTHTQTRTFLHGTFGSPRKKAK